MIEIQHLSCTLCGKTILNDISCRLEKGKLTAIIGPNGSGKSTLLKCIMQFIKSYTGKVLIDDENPQQMDMNMAKKVTYFEQNTEIVFPHTVFNTALMGRRPRAPYFYREKDKKITEEKLNDMALTMLRDSSIDKISGGERQKAFFARALAQDTKHILLDEPFNNLDQRFQMAIIKGLTELKENKVIAVVLHDISLLRFFDLESTIMLKDGTVFPGKVNCDTLGRLYDVPIKEYRNGEDIIYGSADTVI
jgi:iron complex transport system ATP-binding protein